jgi:hypothetical protein
LADDAPRANPIHLTAGRFAGRLSQPTPADG